MEQVNLNIRIPKYAKIFFSALRWGIVVTLQVEEEVMNSIASEMDNRGEEIPANMFFLKKNRWYYQRYVGFDYDPKVGIGNAADEADKLLRDMQKDITLGKIQVLQRRLKRLDYSSWLSENDIQYYDQVIDEYEQE